MKYLKTFFLVVIALSTIRTLYSTFQDITHLFPEPYQGKVSAMPINGNLGEKLIFVNPKDKNESARTFRLNAKNQVTDITKNGELELDSDYLKNITSNANSNKNNELSYLIDTHGAQFTASSYDQESPLILIIYSSLYRNPAKLIHLSHDQIFDISDQYPDLKALSQLTFAHLISVEHLLYIYGLENGTAKFFCLDQESKTITEITHQSGLKCFELINIKEIKFSNNSPSQLVCIIYHDNSIKLFSFSHGIFNNVTQDCRLDKHFLKNSSNVQILQDAYGTTILFNSNLGNLFRIIHNSEITCSYTLAKRTKRAHQ